jgi:hypothetical protein
MRRKSLVATIGLGLLAFSVSSLSVTTAEAGDCQVRIDHCRAGESEVDRNSTGYVGGEAVTCCTTPSVPYATGESAAEREARFKKEAAKLKADCEARGKLWDSASNQCKQAPCPEGQMRTKASGGKCEKPGVVEGTTSGNKGGFIKMKPNCAAGTVYSESENNCVAAPPPQEQTSDEGGGKKKKKKKHDDD